MDFSRFEAEWHPTKNLPLVFSESLNVAWKYWWLGECGHEWEATLNKRTGKSSGCLVCSSLAIAHPDLASEWHPARNGGLSPTQISPKASGKYWWLGACGHEWEAYLTQRIKGKNRGCLVCSSLAVAYPEIASEWHPTRNDAKTATQISAKSRDKYWWLGACGHEWEAYLVQRIEGKNRGCLVCSGSQFLAGFNDLVSVNPSVASEWHPTKNNGSVPERFAANSDAKVYWICSENHEWEATIQSRASKRIGCPYCEGRTLLVGFNDFVTLYPKLALELHPVKNGDLNPEQFLPNSTVKAWWLGECGHEWETSFTIRSRGSRCPYCANQKILAGFNDLATINPDLAAEWHPTKNNELSPEDVSAGSEKKVWWLDQYGHGWEATVSARRRGSKCPICEHPETYDAELLLGINDLASSAPEIAAQWHPTKNGNLTPNSVIRMFDEKVWWIGDCGFVWEATPKSRKTTDCPECTRLKIRRGVNDLASVNPVIAAQWHPTKNSPLTSNHVSVGSEKKVWWLCSENHEWEALVKNRVGKGSGCPVCAGKSLLAGFNDLATVHPDIASEWHPVKNGNLTPEQVFATYNGKKVWWLGKCGHEWEIAVYYRSKGSKCPECSGQRKFNGRTFLGRNIVFKSALSETAPEIAAEWHPTKNGELTPQQVGASSSKTVWWLGACGHEWDTAIADRTQKGFGCPVCSNHRVAIGINDLTTTNPEIAAEWHPTKNGELTPHQVTHGSHKKVWWLGECGHEWEYEVRHRVQKNKGCLFCK